MGNEKNLVPNEQRTPEERRENARKAGIASGEARRAKKTTRELAELLDALPVTGANKELLEHLGVPEDDQTQQMVRIVALHKKAMSGDVQAVKLWLEITGEAPTQKFDVNIENDRTREAYDRAAAAIRGEKK